MKTLTGVVVKVQPKYVSVRTLGGKVFNLSIKNYTPNIGDIYTGRLYKNQALNKFKTIFLTSTLCIILLSIFLYNYFKTTATIIVNMPPSIELKINKWNRTVSSNGLQSSGKKLNNSIKLKNKSLNDSLETLITEAKAKNYIDKKYIDEKKTITIYVSSESNVDLDLTRFDSFMKQQKLKYQVNNNGTGIFVQ